MQILSNAPYPFTGASFPLPEIGSHWRGNTSKTWFLSGTLGSGGSVLLEVSPDDWYQPAQGAGSAAHGVPDASSRWFTINTFSALGYFTEINCFRKVRAVVAAGDGTTNLTLEGVGC
jgi:hypothetical protein